MLVGQAQKCRRVRVVAGAYVVVAECLEGLHQAFDSILECSSAQHTEVVMVCYATQEEFLAIEQESLFLVELDGAYAKLIAHAVDDLSILLQHYLGTIEVGLFARPEARRWDRHDGHLHLVDQQLDILRDITLSACHFASVGVVDVALECHVEALSTCTLYLNLQGHLCLGCGNPGCCDVKSVAGHTHGILRVDMYIAEKAATGVPTRAVGWCHMTHHRRYVLPVIIEESADVELGTEISVRYHT